MKIFKKVLISIALIIGIFLIIAWLMPRDYTISVNTIINKPTQEVFNYLKLYKNQPAYSVRFQTDPNMKIIYSGIDGTVGFTSAWDSKDPNAGAGIQEIKELIDGQKIVTEVRFERPFQSTSIATLLFSPTSGNQTQIISEFSGTDAWPLNILIPIVIKPLLSQQMQQNLTNVKVILEK